MERPFFKFLFEGVFQVGGFLNVALGHDGFQLLELLVKGCGNALPAGLGVLAALLDFFHQRLKAGHQRGG